MNEATPLSEVATHLSADAAAILLQYSPDVQMAVLGAVRVAVMYWEEQNIAYDPITYQAVVNALVIMLAPVHHELELAQQQIVSMATTMTQLTGLLREGSNG